MMHMRCNRRYLSRTLQTPAVAFEPELYLAHLGVFESRGGFEFEQVSPWVALHVVWSGRGVMRADGVDWEVGSGDVFCFFPGMHIYYYDRAETPWNYYWLRLTGRLALPLLAQSGLTPARPLLKGAARALKPVLERLRETLESQTATPLLGCRAAWEVIDLPANAGVPGDRTDWAELAKNHIDACQYALPTAKELADLFGIDRSTLYRAFMKKYDMPIKTCIDRVRLDRAAAMLDASQTTVTRIAAMCGYTTPQYFIRAFRQRFGLTPGQWRDRHPK